MISQRIQNSFARFSIASLFFMMVVIVTLILAVWQVNRGLLAQYNNSIPNPHESQSLQGGWLPLFWLLDNRTEQGKPGYWVLTLFKTDSGMTFPVLLGFLVSQNRSKISLSHLKLPAASNFYKRPWPKSFVWGSPSIQEISKSVWRVQSIGVHEMKLQYSNVQPTLLQLASPPTGLLAVTEADPYLKPYTHFGYAMQWVLLSLAAAFFMFRLRKEKIYVAS